MMDVKEQQRCLSELGIRLMTLRLARNDTMAVFAQRLGVSAGTIRAMSMARLRFRSAPGSRHCGFLIISMT